jgi:hypothetical protein
MSVHPSSVGAGGVRRAVSPLVRVWRSYPVVSSLAVASTIVALRAYVLGIRLDGPLGGSADGSIWESMGYYFARNLTFTPFPHLTLSSDATFFPYGTDVVFQPWSVERDWFYATLFTHVGLGPWVQLYCVLSLFASLAGTYVVLAGDFGRRRAALAAGLVTFFDFYSSAQYPNHVNLFTTHWLTLSLFADFLLTRRAVLRRPITLRLVLFRLALLSLSLGEDLGYIAGFASTSFVLSGAFILAVTGYRAVRERSRPAEAVAGALRAFAGEARRHPLAVTSLAVLGACAAFLYVPLALQIALDARRFDFTRVPDSQHYASPLRLLLPFFPTYNPVDWRLRLGDARTSGYSGTVGWTLLVLGLSGLWGARRRWPMYLPGLCLLALCLSYRSIDAPTLKVFPWFSFARDAERATVVYPILFATLALSLDLDGLRRGFRRTLAVLVAILAVVEGVTATALQEHSVYHYPREFFDYMRTVRSAPGAAVLDWPFCVTGGNSVGVVEGLCPYYALNHSDLSYRTYHEKKTVGQYFGRLHPSQLSPFLKAHWDRLFVPDEEDSFRARGQTRCFDEREWAFFTSFFSLNDFAGIQLHKPLLPPGCVEEFYARFGRPSAEATLPSGDSLAFVPKPPSLAGTLDPVAGAALVFDEPFEAGTVLDAIERRPSTALSFEGLSGFEHLGGESWRWGEGGTTSLAFFLPERRSLHLRFTFFASSDGQRVVARINGRDAATRGPGLMSDAGLGEVAFDGEPGWNRIEFESDFWNGKGGRWFAPKDPRPMSIRWTRLRIE